MKRLLTSILMLLSVMVMQAQQVVHTVQRGETLESIAEKYHVTKETITQNNPNVADAFYVGLKLYIPTAQSEMRMYHRVLISLKVKQFKNLHLHMGIMSIHRINNRNPHTQIAPQIHQAFLCLSVKKLPLSWDTMPHLSKM